ncbi:hypothetical protein OG760_23030 [Streptomyces sp. NBC_00963]|uniref:hypothetical protein n=1 Tax=Streptomyces sp. NBC_00963 TaxID=2903697 RepID=UPI003864015E|nr:hypothetical protein OG760_23030 [Streptomyces sp. NBC_00963]
MRGSRAAALLFGLTSAVTLTACGVPPSGAIEAGEPASGIVSTSAPPSTPPTVSLFFLHDGDLTAYPRRTEDTEDLGAVVRLLFEGLTASESATATTELPHLTDAIRVSTGKDGSLSVQLPGVAAPLSHQAMLQLACTVAPSLATTAPLPKGEAVGGSPRTASTHSSVHVLGDGWTMTQSPYACPVADQPQDARKH